MSQNSVNDSDAFNRISLNTFQALESILSKLGSIISYKLSFNQSLQIKSNQMEINYRKAYTQNFLNNYLDMSQGSILVTSSLCSSLNLDVDQCSNTIITSQVNLYLKF
jgi:hypothetical protein